MLDLREKDRTRLLTFFQTYFKDQASLWAYGSRVKGRNHEGSDLDLVVVPKGGQDLASTIKRFREALINSNIPITIQVQDWARIPASFQLNIQEEKVILVD
jgi:predicted nucleotidyltransferase